MKFKLRKWRLEDVQDVAHFANNKKIAANLRNTFPFPYTLEDAEGYMKSCVENGGKDQICRAIQIDGRAVGSIGIFCGQDVYEKSAELGYWLAEEYWGKGIMSEAVRQICVEAFLTFDIEKIYASPFAFNEGSRRVLEKAGFILEGTIRKGVFKNGIFHDYYMYGLLKEEYESR